MKLAVRITKLQDKGYRAWCPVLPGCEVTGETWAQTIDGIQKAVDAYLASLDAAPMSKRLLPLVDTASPA